MIKRYLEFIKEEKFNTIGEWVESLYMMTIKNIVNRYIGYTPDIRVLVVNILDEKIQMILSFQ
jgi:serine protease inhibitor